MTTDMSGGTPAKGNPLQVTNYLQLLKWGNPIENKWKGSDDGLVESSRRYEGDKYQKKLVIVRDLEYHVIKTLTDNKAFDIINTSLLVRGFCVNDGDYASQFGWFCDRVQTRWSDSALSGSSEPTTTRSKGKPSFISNAASGTSNMAWVGLGNTTIGNPLTIKNFWANYKWGKFTGTNNKWSGTGKPDTEEARNSYEGEKYRKSL